MTRTHKLLVGLVLIIDAAMGYAVATADDLRDTPRSPCRCDSGHCPALLEPARKGGRP